jgi:hypothetical protein
MLNRILFNNLLDRRKNMNLKAKDLITDNNGRLGIVLERAKEPDSDWLKIQRDTRMREVPIGTIWWHVLPLSGGGILVPETLAKFEREATNEDLLEAYNNSNAAGLISFQQFLVKFSNHQSDKHNIRMSHKRKMKIILKNELYQVLAAEFQYQQIGILKQVLIENGISGVKAKKITGEFTFSLAMLIDQGEIEHNGEIYRPSITFTSNEETHIAQPAEIDFHDYAFGSTEEVFEQESK